MAREKYVAKATGLDNPAKVIVGLGKIFEGDWIANGCIFQFDGSLLGFGVYQVSADGVLCITITRIRGDYVCEVQIINTNTIYRGQHADIYECLTKTLEAARKSCWGIVAYIDDNLK